jgi:hypothetical protein
MRAAFLLEYSKLNMNRRSSNLLAAGLAFLALFVPALAAQTGYLKVTVELANIRQRPDIGSPLVAQLPLDTLLESLGKDGEWYIVRFTAEDGKSLAGYVHESLVAPSSPPAAAEAPAPEAKPPVEEQPTTIPPAPPKRPPTSRFRSRPASVPAYTFEVAAGGIYLAGGDPNPALRGLAESYQAALGIPYAGRPGSVHLGPSLGFTLDYWFQPWIGVGAAVDIIYAGDEGVVTYTGGGTSAQLDLVPQIDSVPVRVHLALAPAPDIVVKAGLELHFARCRYLYRFTNAGASTKWTGYSRARGLGLYASVSWERPIFGPVSFLVEASGRSARLSGFDGSGVLKNPDGRTSAEDGTLYYYESATGGNDSVPLLFIRERQPSGPGVSGAREARVDFSGISLRAGLKVRF